MKFKARKFSTANRKKNHYNTCQVIGKIKPIRRLVCKSHLLWTEAGNRGRCREAEWEREGENAGAAFSTTWVDSATQAADCCCCMLLESQPASWALTELSKAPGKWNLNLLTIFTLNTWIITVEPPDAYFVMSYYSKHRAWKIMTDSPRIYRHT